MKIERKAILFDMFVSGCKFFDGNSEANNGYGCNHPEQEEKQNGIGCCFCFSCPMGYPADEESFCEKDIDFDGADIDDIGEDDYIIVPIEELAKENEHDGHLVYDTYQCPNCGKEYELEYEEHEYCPECGQHMCIKYEQEE